MKIAIASVENNIDSKVSERGARAPYYLIFDNDFTLIESIKNPFAIGSGGAAYSVAQMFLDKEINVFIAGKFGEKMIGVLDENSIKHFEFNGFIKDAFSLFN